MGNVLNKDSTEVPEIDQFFTAMLRAQGNTIAAAIQVLTVPLQTMLSDLLVNSFIEHREEIEKWSKIELQVDSTLDTDFDSCTDLLKDNLTKLTELNLLSLAVSKEQSRAVHQRKFMSLAQTMEALKTSDSVMDDSEAFSKKMAHIAATHKLIKTEIIYFFLDFSRFC